MVNKDFDQIFQKIFIRLQQSVLFDEDEINMAGTCLKLIANSFQMYNLIRPENMNKIFNLFDQEELVFQAREALSDIFLTIAKNMSLRRVYFKQNHISQIMKQSLAILEQ